MAVRGDLQQGVKDILHSNRTSVNAGNAVDLRGATMVALHVTGTFVATITFEASIDGASTWSPISLTPAAGGAAAATATAPGIFYLPLGLLLDFLRANITAYTSGGVFVQSRKGV